MLSGFQPPTTKPGIQYPRTMKTVQFTPLRGFRGGFHLRGAMSWRFLHTWHHINQIANQKEKTEGAKGKLTSSHRGIEEQMGAVWPSAAAHAAATGHHDGQAEGKRGREVEVPARPRLPPHVQYHGGQHPSPSLPPHCSALSLD
jgi:hypothetical protein